MSDDDLIRRGDVKMLCGLIVSNADAMAVERALNETPPADRLTEALRLPEVAALVDKADLAAIWVRAALDCKDWHWDADQYDAAEWSCNELRAALRPFTGEGK
jgi:hypothetical protein